MILNKYLYINIVVINTNIDWSLYFATAFVRPYSWVVILASALWQPLLQVGGPACLHDTECDDWLPQSKGAVTAVIISISSIAGFLVRYLSSCVCVILVIFSKVRRGCTAVAVFIVCWVQAFCPVTSPQKKLTLKYSPVSKYPSTRFDRIQTFIFHTLICISCTVVLLSSLITYYCQFITGATQ